MTQGFDNSAHVTRIPLDQIRPDSQRHFYGTSKLDTLAHLMSIRGLIEPIIVRRLIDGYEIVDGKKRWCAARFLGWRSIDATLEPES